MSRMFAVSLLIDSVDSKTELYHELVKVLEKAPLESFEIDDIIDVTDEVEQNCSS